MDMLVNEVIMKSFDTHLIDIEITEIEISRRHCEEIKSVTPKWT